VLLLLKLLPFGLEQQHFLQLTRKFFSLFELIARKMREKKIIWDIKYNLYNKLLSRLEMKMFFLLVFFNLLIYSFNIFIFIIYLNIYVLNFLLVFNRYSYFIK